MSAHLCEQCGYMHMSEGAQKRFSDPPEQDLQRVGSPCCEMVCHHLSMNSVLCPLFRVLGTELRFCDKSRFVFKHRVISPHPFI